MSSRRIDGFQGFKRFLGTPECHRVPYGTDQPHSYIVTEPQSCIATKGSTKEGGRKPPPLVAMQLCGSVAMQPRSYVAMWLCGNVAKSQHCKTSRLKKQNIDFESFKVSKFQTFKVSKLQSLTLSKFQTFKFQNVKRAVHIFPQS